MLPQILCFGLLLSGCHGQISRSSGPQWRVIHGIETERNAFPFQIAILNERPSIWGSGSLVSNRLIVTAAHCLLKDGHPVPLQNFTLVAGEHNLVKSEGTEQRTKVQQAIAHEDYDRHLGINDIAVLQSKEPFKLNKYVQTVRLADLQTEYDSPCKVSGWGYAKARAHEDPHVSSGYPTSLRVTEIDIIEKDICIPLHKDLKRRYEQAAHSSSLCAGNLDGGPDACQGDSGGPLTCTASDDGENVVVGLVSSGVGCGLRLSPRLYTDVAQMNKWLNKTYKKLEQ